VAHDWSILAHLTANHNSRSDFVGQRRQFHVDFLKAGVDRL
jgi:hypothetical protein